MRGSGRQSNVIGLMVFVEVVFEGHLWFQLWVSAFASVGMFFYLHSFNERVDITEATLAYRHHDRLHVLGINVRLPHPLRKLEEALCRAYHWRVRVDGVPLVYHWRIHPLRPLVLALRFMCPWVAPPHKPVVRHACTWELLVTVKSYAYAVGMLINRVC